MNIKMKIYAVSISACQQSEDLIDTSKGMIYWEHAPLVLTSDSMKTAAIQSRVIAFDRWKREEGWSMHSASIMPVTNQFIEQFIPLVEGGFIADDDVFEEQFFSFDGERTQTDFDNVISSDTH